MVEDEHKVEFSMDGNLKKNLTHLKKVIRKDWDMTFIVDGIEGSGKSVFAQQLAAFCDPNFSLDNVAFTPKEFQDKVLSAKKYSAVVFDEALTGFMSRNAMGSINRALVQMMAEIRQRNLFIFIVLPSFFDLDRNIALWRSRGVFHVYTDEQLERGRFAFWNHNKKKLLYVLGKKFYSYGKPVPAFRGRFTNFYPLDEEKYRELKMKALTDRKEEKKEQKTRARNLLIYLIIKQKWIKQVDLSNYLADNGESLSGASISTIFAEFDGDVDLNFMN